MDQRISQEPLASASDIRFLYRVFLGREPESRAVIEASAGRPLSERLGAVLGCSEFHSQVCLEFLRSGQLPHLRTSWGPGSEELRWLLDICTLEQTTQERIQAVRSWRAFFGCLFRDAHVRQLIPGLRDTDFLKRQPLPTASDGSDETDVIGAIDFCMGGELAGWAANPLNLERKVVLEILINGRPVGLARCNELRRDIQDRLGGDGIYGFRFALPLSAGQEYSVSAMVSAVDARTRVQLGGAQRIDLSRERNLNLLEELNSRLRDLEIALVDLRRNVPAVTALNSYGLSRYDVYARHLHELGEYARQQQMVKAAQIVEPRLLTLIVVPTSQPAPIDPAALSLTFRSIARQTYPFWQLLICADCVPDADADRNVVERFFRDDARVKIHPAGGGGAGDLNAAIMSATGSFLCLLQVGDQLSEDALFRVAEALNRDSVKLIYADEDKAGTAENSEPLFHTPCLKPDYDWDLQIGSGYIGRAFFVESDLARSIGGVLPLCAPVQVLDFVLRATERAAVGAIAHIPRVLFHIRDGTPQADAEVALRDQERIRCVTDHLARTQRAAAVEALVDRLAGACVGSIGLRWALPRPVPSVAVIVPARDRLKDLELCLSSLVPARDAYPGAVEIIVVDNDSAEPETRHYLAALASPEHRVLTFGGTFNWSAINNHAAFRTEADVLLFLNNDTVVIETGVLSALVAQAMRSEVGAVGGRLLYEDGTVQHAGILCGGSHGTQHDGLGQHGSEPGYLRRLQLTHQVSAVTGACLATRRSVFEQLGGFDDREFSILCSDADYCLRARDQGYIVLYEPRALLYHRESASRGYADEPETAEQVRGETARFMRRWHRQLDDDPFYNRHFDRNFAPFTRLRIVE